ncbi:MAG TPA: hypothetical protein PKX00_03440 [Opitutaceae bacterium]|nr:hypothetical protein [Opitutaceae bacterium]
MPPPELSDQPAGIFDIPIPGNWVLPDNQLWLALAKPPLDGSQPILDDTSRPKALALAQRLFARNTEGQFPIAVGAAGKAAVVLFPEFAFGSGDFAAVDALIREQTEPVVTIAGFGAVRGDVLRAQIQAGQVQCGWATGLPAIEATKRYNAAWCWIHDPRRHDADVHRCFVILKNWPDQREERVNIPDIAQGTAAVRLVADDCIIFPVICADVLCVAADGPHERIAASIRASAAVSHKMILVPVMMLDGKPSHGAWRTRIADLIAAAPLKVAVVTCNHVSVAPLASEDDDQVRCLSGALVAQSQYSPDHRETPHPVRPVKFGAVAGYVLRSPAPGIVTGDFIWREVGLVNRFIWLPNSRGILEGANWVSTIESPVQIETLRWCERIGLPPWLTADSPGDLLLRAGRASFRQALKVGTVSSAVWPESLTGRGLDRKFGYLLDSAGGTPALRQAMDEAYLSLGTLMLANGYRFEPQTNPGHFHRPAADEKASRDIIIWSSPDWLYEQQMQALQEAALNGRYGATVVVIGRAAGGVASPFMRVVPTATTDFSTGPAGDDDDITQPPVAPVLWLPLGALHTLLAQPAWAGMPEAQRSGAFGQALADLLNRPAA